MIFYNGYTFTNQLKKSEKIDNRKETIINIIIKGYPAELIGGKKFFKLSISLKIFFIIDTNSSFIM